MKQQCGVTIWLTGLSGAGKTTICQAVEKELQIRGYKIEVLDGDLVRQTLTKGLGFSKEDRQENIRRIGFVAHLLTRNDVKSATGDSPRGELHVIVLVSVISPYTEIRQQMRQLIGNFIEVYVNTPLEVCEQRDVKGLYKKARNGEIKNFTGIDDPYEIPDNPDVECNTVQESIAQSATKVLNKLQELGYISRESVTLT